MNIGEGTSEDKRKTDFSYLTNKFLQNKNSNNLWNNKCLYISEMNEQLYNGQDGEIRIIMLL